MTEFSVLMSVYYREKGEFLRTALESIFNQTVPPTEVVLVQDGPLTDELYLIIREFAEKYDTFKTIPLPQNIGLGKALNEGMKHCSYNLVARMDSDDICLDNRFEEQLKAFQSNPQTDIIGGWIEEFNNDFTISQGYRCLPENHIDILRFFKSKSPLNHVTVMFKKDIVCKAGGYQDFYLLEDYWLWGRLIAKGAKLYNVQKILVLTRGGIEMSARRGGWKYARSEVKLQVNFLKMKLISLPCFLKNVLIRFSVRMMPNKLRSFVYMKLLRKRH